MDFEPSHWLEILRNNPVLVVMLGGLVGGNAITGETPNEGRGLVIGTPLWNGVKF